MSKKIDTLDFIQIDPFAAKEEWMDCGNYEDEVCVAVLINGIDMKDIFTFPAWLGHEGRRTRFEEYGHADALHLYEGLTEYAKKDANDYSAVWAEPFRCNWCGEYGCASFTFDAHCDGKYVYWHNWEYVTSPLFDQDTEFCFELEQYKQALQKLKPLAEKQREVEDKRYGICRRQSDQ